MNPFPRRALGVALVSLLLLAGCEDRNPTELEIGRLSTDPVVFDDTYGEGIYFQPFFETHYFAASVDSVFAYDRTRPGGVGFGPDGARSLKFEIPPAGSSLGLYSGGVLTPAVGRDLTDYNALTFYVRSDADGALLDVVGFGNDNTGNSLYETSTPGILLTREWTYHIVPIPDPSRFINERGLFLFAEGAEPSYPDGYGIWFDEIRFEKLDGLDLRLTQLAGPSSLTRRYFTGMTLAPGNGTSIYQYRGENLRVDHSARFYDFTVSGDAGVASVNEIGDISIRGTGAATITATFGETAVRGAIRLQAYDPPVAGPDAPTLPPKSVVSLFSDVYGDHPVDTWKADWGGVSTQYADYVVGGDNAKLYYDMNYFGIEFLSRPIDVSQMTHLHVDVYAVEGTQIEVRLQALTRAGEEDTVVILNAASTPAFAPGGWSSLEIPLSNFSVSETWDWSNLMRFIIGASADVQLILVDNVYWHK